LAGDNQGAIMVIGIFMACAMIGLMWEFIGLGDAMIWRDRSQEASDAVAFSSAAVQARAMNFIAFLNMIMLLMTILYLASAFLYNILDLVLVIVGREDKGAWWDGNPFLDQCEEHEGETDLISAAASLIGIPAEPLIDIASYFCSPIASGVEPVHDGLKKFIDKYRDIMVKTMPYMADAQTLIATAAPFAGALTGSVVGYSYQDYGKNRLGTSISGTMIPASVFPNKNEWTHDGKKYEAGDNRIFLPVEEKKMNELCVKAGDEIMSFVKGKVPGIIATVVNLIIGGISGAMKDSFCKKGADGMFPTLEDGIEGVFLWSGPGKDTEPFHFPDSSKGEFWEKSGGPKHVVEYAENGNDWMQVYGLVLGTNAPENSQRKVATNGFNWATAAIPQAGFAVYMSQAEFYFDCTKKWPDPGCNYKDLSMYELSWRARMRRVHALNWATDLFGYYSGTAFGEGFGSMVSGAISESAAFKSVVNVIKPMFGSMGEKYGTTLADKGVEAGWKKLKELGDDKVKGMLSGDTLMPEIIH
jgi:hypothetical protein